MWIGRCKDGGRQREESGGAGGSRRDAGCSESSFGERSAGAGIWRFGEDRKDGRAGGKRGAEHTEERGCRDCGDAGGGGGKRRRRQGGGTDGGRPAPEKCKGFPGPDAAGGGGWMEAAATAKRGKRTDDLVQAD